MDRYDSFDELCKHTVEGRDFRIRTAIRTGQVAVIAAHGGGIEPGTSELAEAIAGTAFSFYAFEGTRPNNNRDLHITSTRFREARCDALVADTSWTILSTLVGWMVEVYYKIVSATDTFATPIDTSSNRESACGAAAYKDATGAGAAPRTLMLLGAGRE